METFLTRAITLVALICLLVVGAAATSILGRDSVPAARYEMAASAIETGKVRIQASARLRTVRHCSPEPFAAIVPATPEDSTWVVLTGRPNFEARPMVNMATSSADAPCA